MASTSHCSLPELLIQQLALLRALADSLQRAHLELMTTTPAKLDQQTARQRELCRQLCALAVGSPERGYVRTHTGLANDLQETARRVEELNRKYAALLRRRRRTVDIFCRVLASSGTTYTAPKLLSRLNLEVIRPKG